MTDAFVIWSMHAERVARIWRVYVREHKLSARGTDAAMVYEVGCDNVLAGVERARQWIAARSAGQARRQSPEPGDEPTMLEWWR